MILLTVGTQLPFDRLVKLVDDWARRNPETDILAQIAEGEYQPQHMDYVKYLDEQQYAKAFESASVILAHAGMGTVISSLINSKPVIVYPRRASLGEHRNEHQLATCSKLAHLKGCYVAYEPEQLYQFLDDLNSLEGGEIGPYANDDLIDTIDRFITQQT